MALIETSQSAYPALVTLAQTTHLLADRVPGLASPTP
jgi:hypothetical protein